MTLPRHWRKSVPKKSLVIVFDTNILISYLFGGFTITTLIDAVEKGAYIPVLSPYLEQEFLEVMHKPEISLRVNIVDALNFMREWKNFANYITPRHKVTAYRDHNDNEVLACALEASADYIISGDKDLLVLKEFHGIRIISPADFVKNVLR